MILGLGGGIFIKTRHPGFYGLNSAGNIFRQAPYAPICFHYYIVLDPDPDAS